MLKENTRTYLLLFFHLRLNHSSDLLRFLLFVTTRYSALLYFCSASRWDSIIWAAFPLLGSERACLLQRSILAPLALPSILASLALPSILASLALPFCIRYVATAPALSICRTHNDAVAAALTQMLFVAWLSERMRALPNQQH